MDQINDAVDKGATLRTGPALTIPMNGCSPVELDQRGMPLGRFALTRG